ncbi:MAG: heparinase II/III family protein [Lentisphaeria bacterium]|nr:heparinase II/III family protein [Lentisphaeria bacterium]
MRTGPFAVSLLTLSLLHATRGAEAVWWEGEDTTANNFAEHPWLEMDAKAREGLSGNDWLALMHKPDQAAPAEGAYAARYRVRVPAASRYHLWAREWPRPQALPSRWRFDEQPWRETTAEYPFEDRIPLAKDRGVAWTRYGEVDLAAGEHTFELRLDPHPGNAAFDCFLLCRSRFQPAGKQRPEADAETFVEDPEGERVEDIVRRAKEAAAARQAQIEEVRRSKVNEVSFLSVGGEIDVVRFGADYAQEFAAHDGSARAGDPLPPRHIAFGANGFIEWALQAPAAGDYVLTVSVNIARLPDRTAMLKIRENGAWRDYGILAQNGEYHCRVSLAPGPARFRVESVGGRPVYFGGARLSTPRGDPWQGARPSVHPRLQFTEAEAKAIQQRLEADPDHPVRYYYDGLLAAAGKQVAAPAALRDPRGSAQALNEVAVAFALTGRREFGDRGADYLDRLSRKDFGRNPTSVLGNGEYLDAMAWGYDALYPHLTEDLRQRVRERLDIEAQWLWTAARTLSKDTIQGWWASDHANNWQAVSAGGLGMAALALLGENPSAELWLREALTQVKMLMDGAFDADGAYFESPMYHKYAMEYLTTFASALRRTGGEDLFEYRGQLLRQSCLYNLYMMEPTRDHFPAFNDGRRLAGNPPQALHPAGAYFARIAAVHRDGLVRWLFDAMYGPQRRFPVWNFQHGHPDSVVWYDETLPVEDPDSSPRLALARCWPEHGRAALRTGWADPNGILFAMECGHYGSHGHADQGSFTLTAYGEHLVDDTGYGGWEAESEAHSVILIDGKGQGKNGMLGSIRDFLHTPAMDYFEADSTPAYAPASLVKRHVVFLRPNAFLIADEVRKDDEPHTYEWLLHAKVGQPGAAIGIKAPDRVTFQCERAALEIRLFGAGQMRTEAAEKNGHRFLRVTTATPRPEARFLALLQPTDPENPAPPATAVEDGNLTGCRVGEDVVLWPRAPGEWRYGPLRSDAFLAVHRPASRCLFVKAARNASAPPLGFRSDGPITAVLWEGETRLVASAPVNVTFAPGYLAGAAVFATDQDRDAANDIRVAAVDDGGRVTLPAGAYTVRR